MADGDITIPGTKSRVSRPVAYAGLAAVGVLVIIYYRNRKAQAAAAPASTPTSQYPPDGTSGNPSDPYSTDPATGQTYGNEAAGSGGTLGAFGSGAASGMYYDPATGAYDLTSPYGTTSTTQPYQVQGGPPFSSNSAWADWVIQEIQAQNPAVDVAALTDAIGLYLNGQPLSATQRAYVFDAIAIGGDPPVAGASGYPPKLQGNGSTGPGTGTVAVPAVIGKTVTEADALIKAAGLVPGAHSAEAGTVNGQTPGAGAKVAPGSTVDLSVAAPAAVAEVTVPNVVGKRAGSAVNELTAAGLHVSNRPNSNYIVRSTSIKAGTKVKRGQSLSITATPPKAGEPED